MDVWDECVYCEWRVCSECLKPCHYCHEKYCLDCSEIIDQKKKCRDCKRDNRFKPIVNITIIKRKKKILKNGKTIQSDFKDDNLNSSSESSNFRCKKSKRPRRIKVKKKRKK